jgi:hypothetical protein
MCLAGVIHAYTLAFELQAFSALQLRVSLSQMSRQTSLFALRSHLVAIKAAVSERVLVLTSEYRDFRKHT